MIHFKTKINLNVGSGIKQQAFSTMTKPTGGGHIPVPMLLDHDHNLVKLCKNIKTYL